MILTKISLLVNERVLKDKMLKSEVVKVNKKLPLILKINERRPL